MGTCLSSQHTPKENTPSPVQRYVVTKSESESDDCTNLTIAEFTPQPGISLAACNNFLLFARFHDTSSELFLANPITKHLINLNSPTPGSETFFDHVLGMTYLPCTKQHKILHYYTCNSRNKIFSCEILTLDEDSTTWGFVSWRFLNLKHTRVDYCRQSQKIVFVKNIAHQMVSEVDDYGGVNYFIISFDLANEELYKTIVPKCSYEEVEVLEIGGVLCLLNPAKNGVVNEFEKWDMKGVGKEGWVKQQSIQLGGNLRSVSIFASVVFDYGQILVYGVNDQPYSYHVYDIRTKAKTSLQIDSESKSPWIHTLVFKTLKFP